MTHSRMAKPSPWAIGEIEISFARERGKIELGQTLGANGGIVQDVMFVARKGIIRPIP